jgi:hypothetical protein
MPLVLVFLGPLGASWEAPRARGCHAAPARRARPPRLALPTRARGPARTRPQGVSWNVGHCASGLIANGVVPPFVVCAVDSAGPMRSFNYLPYKPGAQGGCGGWGAGPGSAGGDGGAGQRTARVRCRRVRVAAFWPSPGLKPRPLSPSPPAPAPHAQAPARAASAATPSAGPAAAARATCGGSSRSSCPW